MRTKAEAVATARVIDRTTGAADVSITEAPRDPHTPADSDRRLQPRYGVALSVTLLGDHNFYVGLSENISEGGLFVRTQHLLPIGTRIRMEFFLPTCAAPLSVFGEVRWVRSPNAVREDHNNFGSGGDEAFKTGLGIQFKQLAPETAAAIVKYIGIRRPDFYEE